MADQTSPFPSRVGAHPIDPRIMFTRGTIAALLAQTEKAGQIVQQSLLSPKPVDLTGLVIESFALIMRAQALILDEFLVSEGERRECRFTARADGGNGL